jgi:hypothetical protein
LGGIEPREAKPFTRGIKGLFFDENRYFWMNFGRF